MTKWKSVAEYFSSRYVEEAIQAAEYATRRTGFDNLDGAGKFASEGQKQIFTPGIYVIGAPPSAGKTSLVLQLQNQLADRGEPCLLISYEMSVQALCRKLIARKLFEDKQAGESVTLLSSADIRRAGVKNDDVNRVIREFADNLNHLQILNVDWEASTLIKNLRAFTSESQRPPVIAIDYLQLVPNKGKMTAKEKIDSLLSDLRKFQNDTQSTLILVSSFNRANGMMSEATFSSFKESGAIEYTADVLWTLEPLIKGGESMTEADRRERQNKVRAMRLRCLKAREGALYEVYFRYHAAYDTFEACTDTELLEEPEKSKSRYCK